MIDFLLLQEGKKLALRTHMTNDSEDELLQFDAIVEALKNLAFYQ